MNSVPDCVRAALFLTSITHHHLLKLSLPMTIWMVRLTEWQLRQCILCLETSVLTSRALLVTHLVFTHSGLRSCATVLLKMNLTDAHHQAYDPTEVWP